MKRILYLQYTTPAAYPPLMHSSRILAERDWKVRLLGAPVAGVEHFRFPSHANVELHWTRVQPRGLRQKLHYLGYLRRAQALAREFRPDWIYVSDPWSAPAGNRLRELGYGVIYHEHDAPAPASTRAQRWVHHQRKKLIETAQLVIVPNEGRRRLLVESFQRTGPTLLVWNCPLLGSIPPALPRAALSPFHFYYHGSLVAERLPGTLPEVLRLLSDSELSLVGYVPRGAEAGERRFREKARALGVEDRIHWLGSQASHERLGELAARCNVGLALVPPAADDVNLRHMAGASNKVFDYFARGLWTLVSDTSDWREAFGDHVVYVDPTQPRSFVDALEMLRARPAHAMALREKAHRRCLTEWNYEAQFAPVLEYLERESAAARRKAG